MGLGPHRGLRGRLRSAARSGTAPGVSPRAGGGALGTAPAGRGGPGTGGSGLPARPRGSVTARPLPGGLGKGAEGAGGVGGQPAVGAPRGGAGPAAASAGTGKAAESPGTAGAGRGREEPAPGRSAGLVRGSGCLVPLRDRPGASCCCVTPGLVLCPQPPGPQRTPLAGAAPTELQSLGAVSGTPLPHV